MTSYQYTNAAEAFLEKKHHGQYINNKWCFSEDIKYIDVVNPSDNSVISKISIANKDMVEDAVSAARKALYDDSWNKMSPINRQDLILRFTELMEDHIVPLAEILTTENGKLLSHAKSEIKGAINTFRYYAGWCTKIEGETLDLSLKQAAGKKNFAFTRKEPVGVVAAVVPWNFPISIAAWKLAPLLAAGCTCVLKPSEVTPLSTLYLAQLFDAAGFPKGVVNVITGDAETGSFLTQDSNVDKVTFTGSTRVGRIIGKAAVNNLIDFSLELGGKSPAIIFEDAEIDSAAKGVAMGIFRNGGQVCVAGSRVYIQESVFDKTINKIIDYARSMKISDGFDPESDLGPLVSKSHLESVVHHIEQGKEEGGELLFGGGTVLNGGCYLEPTVFKMKSNNNTITQEEIFGPVLAAIPFESVDEAVTLSNDSKYGLSSTVWTNDINKAMHCIEKLNAGWVFVNSVARSDPNFPIGGNKHSGMGRELGKEGLYVYLKTKAVNIVY